MSSDTPAYGRGNSAYSIKPKRSGLTVIEILVVFGLIALLIGVLLPSLCRSRESSNRVKCASNMKQIGLAAIIWAQGHGGKFPDDLDSLVDGADLAPAVFNCPTSADSPAEGATKELLLEDFHKPGHLSYVYVGKGLTTDSPADAVVMYELPKNHNGGDMSVTSEFKDKPMSDGMNVLFADGHVEWISPQDAEALLKRVKDGESPVRLWATTEPAKP